MAFKTLERKEAQTLSMGKEGLDTFEGILIAARTGIGRNNSTLYTFRCADKSIKKVWGNVSIDQALLNESGKGIVPEANGRLVRITVLEMVPVGDNGALRPDCSVAVDSDVRDFKIEKKVKK